MMFSMTGFGAARAEAPSLGALAVELRSVNGRFLDLVLRLPQELSSFEPVARAAIQKRFSRGKIYVAIRFDPIPGATETYALNESLLTRLEDFCRDRQVTPNPAELLAIPGVVVVKADESRLEELEKHFLGALARAMDAFAEERAREGETLRAALLDIHGGMNAHVTDIDAVRAQVVERYRAKLHERIEELLGPKGAALDPGRLEQEVALFADKADITEEIMRLRAHLDRFAELLKPTQPEAKGRALDFLAQEILRETNTIGSKARDIEITRHVLELKNLVESLKEQIANVE